MKYRANIGLKSFIVFLSIMLVAMICIGVTSAVYQGSRRGIGTLVMDKGLYYIVENIFDSEGNLTTSGTLQYYPTGDASGEKSDFKLLSGVGQNESYLMAPPKIVVQSNSMSFYARAKIEYKYYTLNGSEYVPATASTLGVSLEDVTSTLFAEKLEFNDRWKKSVDGYYYYLNAGESTPTKTGLGLINASETIEIFKNDKFTTGEWEGDYGGPYGIAKMDISFVLEVVEKNGLNWAFYDIAELGTDFEVEVIDTNKARVTQVNTTKTSLIIPETVMVDGVNCTITNFGSEGGGPLESARTLEHIILPGTIKCVEAGSLTNFCCKSITISEGTESISTLAIGIAVKLEKISLPSTLKKVIDTDEFKTSPFSGCPLLKEIDFVGNDYFSFDGCNLIDVNNKTLVYYIPNTSIFKIPEGVNDFLIMHISLKDLFGYTTFKAIVGGEFGTTDLSVYHEYTSKFEKIEIPSSLTGYEVSSDGRCLIKINGAERELVMFVGKGLTEYTIPDSANITTISYLYGEDLQTIRFSSTIKSYTGGIFEMEKLSKIVLNEGLEEIAGVFDFLPNLTQIKLPSTLTEISVKDWDGYIDWAFYKCENLKTLIFTSINPPKALKKLSATETTGKPFPNNDGMKVYVPTGSLEAYKKYYQGYRDESGNASETKNDYYDYSAGKWYSAMTEDTAPEIE